MNRIALIGDCSDSITAHRAIPLALKLSVEALRVGIAWEWLHSRSIGKNVGALLEPFAGVWCVPGSPYENTMGVLSAIRFARESRRPFLGTCGGFQHALLDYAEAAWGIAPVHAETDPHADNPVVSPLMCALVEVKGSLHFEPGSRLSTIYGGTVVTEEYHCSYGLNPLYAHRLQNGPMKVAARDGEGSIRAVELDDHPFFIGTLFQPERAALRDRLPPLVSAFVSAVHSYAAGK